MRAMYIPWRSALGEGERILDDLRKYTSIDTIMFLDLYTGGARGEGDNTVYAGSQVALAPDTKFHVPVRRMTSASFSELRRFMRSTRERGFKVAALVAPLFICGGRKSMACVDFAGRRVRVRERSIFYGCPNNPEVIAYGQDFVRGLAESWPDMDYLSLDHLEYPINLFVSYPEADPKDLFVCFCDSCRKRARDEGFDMEEARKDVSSTVKALTSPVGTARRDPVDPAVMLDFILKHPRLAEWLRFRMGSMTHYTERVVESFREATASGGRKTPLGFYFQLPALSNLVGTDHDRLQRLFDYAVVKFPDYLPGSIIPIVAEEISRRTRAYGSRALMDAMRRLLDIGPGPEEYRPLGGMKDVLLYSNAVHPSMVERQMGRLTRFPRSKLIPHVWYHNGDVASLRQRVSSVSKYKMKGYTVWAFEDGLEHRNLVAAKGVL